MANFEKLGFFLEYMIDDKYIGSIIIEKPDRKEIGYYGRIDEVARENITFKNKKTIKKGQAFYTRMYPLCGSKL
tara:strand:- start:14 stop:235 length:222 start_codon:yes stop_codon:yes gene_type:complete